MIYDITQWGLQFTKQQLFPNPETGFAKALTDFYLSRMESLIRGDIENANSFPPMYLTQQPKLAPIP